LSTTIKPKVQHNNKTQPLPYAYVRNNSNKKTSNRNIKWQLSKAFSAYHRTGTAGQTLTHWSPESKHEQQRKNRFKAHATGWVLLVF